MQLYVFSWPLARSSAGVAVIVAASWEEAEAFLRDSYPWCADTWERTGEIPVNDLAAQGAPKLIARTMYLPRPSKPKP